MWNTRPIGWKIEPLLKWMLWYCMYMQLHTITVMPCSLKSIAQPASSRVNNSHNSDTNIFPAPPTTKISQATAMSSYNYRHTYTTCRLCNCHVDFIYTWADVGHISFTQPTYMLNSSGSKWEELPWNKVQRWALLSQPHQLPGVREGKQIAHELCEVNLTSSGAICSIFWIEIFVAVMLVRAYTLSVDRVNSKQQSCDEWNGGYISSICSAWSGLFLITLVVIWPAGDHIHQ